MSKIWQKSTTKTNTELSKATEKFTVGNDYLLDKEIIKYDIRASQAHAKGLEKIGVITALELTIIIKALDKLANLVKKNEFSIEISDEDCHAAIERFLISEIGDLGKKIHTGRSRNDQVLVAVRLYTREKLTETIKLTKNLALQFLNFAKKYEFCPMAGYTHTQRAMPSSVGMWAGAIAEMLYFNLETLSSAKKNVNHCPLGSAAAFGVNFDLPREFVSQELGFNDPIIISLASQNSRGKIEADVLAALTSLGATLSHFANDLVWFTSQEFDYFILPEELTTGSSIMPQKKNFDPAELLRARYSQLFSYECLLRDLTKNLISGYHRDLQLSKEPLINGFNSVQEMLEISEIIIKNIQPNEENLRKSFSPHIFATDFANDLVKKGVSFRDAYREIGNNLEKLGTLDIDENLQEKKHLGATGNLGLEIIEKKLASF